MLNIRLIEKRDAASVALLHQTYLTTPLHSTAGLHLLRIYYQNLVNSSFAVGYVAADGDTIAGFVCGVWNAAALRRTMIRKNAFPVLFWTMTGLLTRPSTILSRFQQSGSQAQEHDNLDAPSYELRPIVVMPSHRGKGIAVGLVKTLLADATKRGYPQIFLIAETDNTVANKFYIKMGFHEADQVTHVGKAYIRYVYALS